MARFRKLSIVAALMFLLSIAYFHGVIWFIRDTHTTAIYDKKNQKLWHHASNDTSKVNQYLSEFKGIEFDVNYDTLLKDFDVRHDYDQIPSGVNLDSYFSSVVNCSHFHYWIDLKNLDVDNAVDCGKILVATLDKYKIRQNVIVEGQNPKALGILSNYGINTSYWIPHYNFEFLKGIHKTYAYVKTTFLISLDIRRYNIDAISAHHEMVPNILSFFPKMNVHIWTNGLLYEKDSSLLRNYINTKQIKVILVDDVENYQ